MNAFLHMPPPRRLVLLIAVGTVLIAAVYFHGKSFLPPELSPADSKSGLALVRITIDCIRNTEFGHSPRGVILSNKADEFLAGNRIRFSPNLEQEAVYRKEPFKHAVIYISVPVIKKRILWPTKHEIAERIYHESVHAVANSANRSREEECDAFCAAEQAAVSITGKHPVYPVTRDGKNVWPWIEETYLSSPSDRTYKPVGTTLEDIMEKTGGPH